MQQGELLPRSHPVIFDSDKKQRFGVSNNGEFIDNVYREQDPSKIVGRLIGRNQVQVHAKKVYTTADIVCEAYLHKKGSWMQNWKRRYFVLRKDIRSICYYDNRESLTLLGSIPLDSETQITHVAPKDASGFEHVITMKAEGEDGGPATNTFIRFDNAEQLKSWVLDIKNEALNLRSGEETQQNWWSATFDKIDALEIKSNAVRRENADPGGRGAAARQAQRHSAPPIPTPTSPSEPGTEGAVAAVVSMAESPNMNGTSGQEAVVASMMQQMKIPGAAAPSSKAGSDKDRRHRDAAAPDEDTDDSDIDDLPPTPGTARSSAAAGVPSPSGVGATLSPRRGRENSASAPSGAVHALPGRRTQALTSIAHEKKKRKFKLLKPEKAPGPPPFAAPTIEAFTNPQAGAIRGLQISLKLSNVCAYQDRIFVVLFGNLPAGSAGLPSPPTPASAGTVTSVNDIQTVFGSTGSKWTQISRTELRTVEDKPVYGENYVSDYRIHFSIVQDMIPEACREIRFVVYRQENEMNYREPTKASNLNMQLEMAKCIIPKKMFDAHANLKVAMQVKMEIPMDIAVPLFKEAQVILGVSRMSSRVLYRQRELLAKTLKMNPYSEILFSFATTRGKTLSLEQLYASKYSVSVAQALLNMWQLERNEFIFEMIDKLRKDLAALSDSCAACGPDDKPAAVNKRASGGIDAATAHAISQMAAAQHAHATHSQSAEERHLSKIEHMLAAIATIEDLQQESLECTALVLENCVKMENCKDVIGNVIDPAVGGSFLRRSTWKKYTAWQYCATNLNIHLMLTKHFTFAECLLPGGAGSVDPDEAYLGGGLHCTPTITMGVPAAHELKFSDGGLRRVFCEINEIDQKLRWMSAIQAPNMDLLKLMLLKSPKEAQSLFGAKCNLSNPEDLAHVLKRKMEIAHRLDICAGQALGSAVTIVRTICILAAQLGGRYMDILARSLRIGFVVMFQSMLSTQGHELGMIEDLDIAALWLSLVTVRLVVKEDEEGSDDDADQDRDDYDASRDVAAGFVGKGDGVVCRRDKGGRLIVEIEITAEEGIAVLEAHRNMSGFPYYSTTPRDYPGSPIMFNHSPTVKPSPVDRQYVVYATAELFGVAFSQGVNEMQTLANLSASRDVLRQVEINNGALARLEGYYANYKEALKFQLDQKKPELLEALTGAPSGPSSPAPAPGSHTNSLPRGLGLSRKGSSSNFLGGLGGGGTPSTPPPQSESARSTGGSGGAGGGSPVPGSGLRRRKSLRESVSGDQVMNTVNTLATKVISHNDRMLDQLKEAIAVSALNPHDKHVDVLLKSSAICREMGAVTAILCKSGKDRTSMGVTLENTRSLVEDVGVLHGQEVCQLMRFQGVRRMNVYANTGQAMFAFNHLQRLALPTCYRPPTGCHSGNVNS